MREESGSMKLSTDVVSLTRLVAQLADRFERLAPGEDGVIDPDDKKLVATVRKQLDKVLTAPMREMMKSQTEPPVPSGFQTVIGKDRIFIKHSRNQYSAYTLTMREPRDTPVPNNPPTTEEARAVRDQSGDVVSGKTVQEVKNKLSKIRAFELERT